MVRQPTSNPRKKAAARSQSQKTRRALLEAAREILSLDGEEGLHVTQVARRAGVTRSTAYRYFKTREQLLAVTAQWVSDMLHTAVFDDPAFAPSQPMEVVSAREMIRHLSGFAMDNPELCRIWLHEVVSMERPSTDRFLQRFIQVMRRFAVSGLAQEGIDIEVHTVLMLAGTFLWPVWVQSQARSATEQRQMAERFGDEMYRLALNGALRPEKFPELMARLRVPARK